MNSTRDSMNLITATISIVFVIIYLFTPFYSLLLAGFSMNGFNLIGLNPVAILPVVLGIVVAIGACVFPPLPAIIVEGVTTITVLVMMFMGNTFAASILSQGLGLQAEFGSALNSMLAITSAIHPGWGAVVCLLLCIAALVVDILANRRPQQPKKPYVIQQQDFTFTGDDDFTF